MSSIATFLIAGIAITTARAVDPDDHHLGAAALHTIHEQSEPHGDCQPLDSFSSAHACFDTHNASQGSVFCWQQCLDDVARTTVDDALRPYELQVVTAESLTAGMIASTLVDLSPGYGSYVYGGFAVYDSDAKRKFLGVHEADVYTPACARQMAAGALEASRATASIAVTGQAGPSPPAVLGIVDIAAALRTPGQFGDGSEYTITTRHVEFCNATSGDGSAATLAACDQYRQESESDPNGWATRPTIMRVRRMIRMETVAAALKLLRTTIVMRCGKGLYFGKGGEFGEGRCAADKHTILLPTEPYDGNFKAVGEPSWIIEERLSPS